MSVKLNVLLAKTDALAAYYKGQVNDYGKFFSSKQGAFKGEKKTYTPREDTIDDTSKRGIVKVQTTVTEKLEWFKENAREYVDALFAQEATNASGNAKAELIVDGESWGEFTSLELLRLKSLVEAGGLHSVLENIPVRSDSEVWEKTDDEDYSGREIYESELIKGVNKTTEKENYILKDPNVDASSPNYNPTVATKTTIVELGDYTHQKFTGEWSQRQKAEVLQRRAKLLVAITESLKKANEAEVVSSELSADKIFGYLFGI